MSVSRKFKVSYITFLLLASTFSVFFVTNNAMAEEDPFGISEQVDMFNGLIKALFPEVLYPNPYRFVSEYYHDNSDPIDITGDIVFNLYFSSTLLTQLDVLDVVDFRDSINVSIYSINGDQIDTSDDLEGMTINAELLENAYKTVTLEPEFLGETIQGCTVTLEDVEHTVEPGDFLIFSIEILQSEKPIGDIIENRYDRKLRPKLEKVADFLNQSEDPELAEIGGLINGTLASIEAAGITTEEIGSLASSLRSSSFVYDSKSYPSSVNLSINENESMEIYFHNSISYDLDLLQLGQVKSANTTKSSTDSYAMWPPFSLESLDDPSEAYMDETEWMSWLLIWLIYSSSEEGSVDENIVDYYLTSENKLDSSGPEEGKNAVKISSDPVIWEGPSIERNKIIKSATADIYAYYPKVLTLAKATISVRLLDNNVTIGGPIEKDLNRTGSLELLQGGPNQATIFDFSIPEEGYELEYGHQLNLEISLVKKPLLSLKKVKVVCGSEYPSVLTVDYQETENINMTIDDGETEKYVIPGGSTEYLLNISSEYDDTININVESSADEEESDSIWDVKCQDSVDIKAGEFELVKVTVTCTDDSAYADGEKVDLAFIAAGKTGIDSIEGTVKVDEKAVEYNINITAEPEKQEVKPGEKCTYKFTVKNMNTGIWPDNYKLSASSEHDWDLDLAYDEENLSEVEVRESFVVEVTVNVPKDTDKKSDILSLKVTSRNSGLDRASTTVNVTTKVVVNDIFEGFYDFFESLAEDIGLDDILGDFAATFLILLMFLIPLLIILLIIILIIKKKQVEVICLERIKEIIPEENARYEITIKNPTKASKTYEISIESDPEPEGLDAEINKKNVVIDSKQEEIVYLDVTTNDKVKADDWKEVKVLVKVEGKSKAVEISTVTTVVGAKKDLRIYGVFHWPRVFKKGERVETSFKVENKGNIAATDVTIVLLVNGEEKNKVEGINIPRGGYAEVEIPWIAEKGKNDVEIVVK